MKCLNCGKPVEQAEGKRAKVYCDDACRKAFGRKAQIRTIPDKLSNPDTPKAPIPDISGQGRYCSIKDVSPEAALKACGPCTTTIGEPAFDDKGYQIAFAIDDTTHYDPKNPGRYTGPMTPDSLVPLAEAQGRPRKKLPDGSYLWRVPKPGDDDYEGVWNG